MNNGELLELYRKKRCVDGYNGRTWDAGKHLEFDTAIENEEQQGGALQNRIRNGAREKQKRGDDCTAFQECILENFGECGKGCGYFKTK